VRKPSAGGVPAAISKRLRAIRERGGDLAREIGRLAAAGGRLLAGIPVAAGRGIAGFWRSLSAIARRRLAAAVGVAALLVIFFSAVVPHLPCQVPGGGELPLDARLGVAGND
jgi:hypothetical protein